MASESTGTTGRTQRAWGIKVQDFKILSEQGKQEEVIDDSRSTRSKRSTRRAISVKSVRSEASTTKKKKTRKGQIETEKGDTTDSRQSDFSEEEALLQDCLQHEEEEESDVISLGSDASKLERLQNQIDATEKSVAERYNEFKVQQGELIRVEDIEVPTDIENEELFNETKKIHEEQMVATKNRAEKAKRRVELLKLKEEIIERWEQAKRDEWEAE